MFAWVGAPPASGEGWFHYLPGRSAAWWVILWLSVITDLCYLPVAWALYLVLREASQALMRAALLLLHLFVVLDLAVTWTHHASILAMYRNYTADSDAAHRAAYTGACSIARVLGALFAATASASCIIERLFGKRRSVGTLLHGVAHQAHLAAARQPHRLPKHCEALTEALT